MNNKPRPDDMIQQRTLSPSFIKLAMKNMVRKGGQSLLHLGFTALGFMGFIILLATLGKPHIPQ